MQRAFAVLAKDRALPRTRHAGLVTEIMPVTSFATTSSPSEVGHGGVEVLSGLALSASVDRLVKQPERHPPPEPERTTSWPPHTPVLVGAPRASSLPFSASMDRDAWAKQFGAYSGLSYVQRGRAATHLSARAKFLHESISGTRNKLLGDWSEPAIDKEHLERREFQAEFTHVTRQRDARLGRNED